MNSDFTLGISLGHDSGVALLAGNEIVFAANEERFSRVKGHSGFPLHSLRFLIESGMLKHLNRIAIDGRFVAPHGQDAKYRFEDYSEGVQGLAEKLNADRFLLNYKFGVEILKGVFALLHFSKRKKQQSEILSKLPQSSIPIFRVDHHIAHAASIAFPHNSNTSGLVITLDGIGEGICSRAMRIKAGTLQKLRYSPALGSPALMYGYATKILGFRINRHEGKLTGLAAYGDPEQTARIFRNYFIYENFQFKAFNIGYGLQAISKLERVLEGYSAEDIAAGVQLVLEENVTQYVNDLIRKYDESTLYLSGGAFANVRLNQRIAELPKVRDLIVAPNMGDGGLALGAAAFVHSQKIEFNTLYLGPKIEPVSHFPEGIEVLDSESVTPEFIASLLFQECIIAIAKSRMEYGPRALGNRSILYSARNKDVNGWLNKRLKRTEFMPFAPICRDVDFHKNFIADLPIERYRNMTITCKVTEYCKKTAPAVVHIDGTARPQVLFESDNPEIYKILEEYSHFVENPLLVNTSFNMHEEPIVMTSGEALRAFKQSGIDYLLLNGQLLKNLEVNRNY